MRPSAEGVKLASSMQHAVSYLAAETGSDVTCNGEFTLAAASVMRAERD
jgi:hypothetical protein